jgi:hypothetical protein
MEFFENKIQHAPGNLLAESLFFIKFEFTTPL